MVQLTHAHTVDTRPFLPRREEPGDKAKIFPHRVCLECFLVLY